MKTSQKGIDLIKSFEGCSLTAYWDVKDYSIGYGHLGAKKGQTITKEQAEQLLISDLPSYEKKVEKYDPIYHWNQNEFDALVSYCYNIGSIKGLVDDGKRTREEIKADWPTHDMAGGNHLTSLKERRLTELQYFKGESMTEKQITICGHGSGKPSLKNMFTYLEERYNKKAPNGKRKGVVAVVRFRKFDDAGRKAFHDYYSTILGRNNYSQNLRIYVYHPYKNGLYYSDCSSSGCFTIKEIGYSCPDLNTEGMYLNATSGKESRSFDLVDVKIVNGHITNPEVLKVGDALLFAGDDPKRELQIGHVEYVYIIPEEKSEYPYWVKVPNGIDNDWYYRIAEGVNAHGWQNINGHRYYFDKTGLMLKEWAEIDGKWYYFQPESGKGASLAGALYVSDETGAQRILEV